MAANQRRTPVGVLGFLPPSPTSVAQTLALNTATTWLALGFRPDQAKTLNKVQVYCSAATAGLGASDLTCDIYSDAGQPNASLASVATVTTTPSNLNTPTWVEFTGFSLALSAGVQYWAVLKNANASPSTVNATFQATNANCGSAAAMGTLTHGGWARGSTTNGTTWALTANVGGLRLQFSDGTYDGFPVQAIAQGADKAFGANEVGVQFTWPSNMKGNVRGACMHAQATSTLPSGNLVYRLYQNGTLVAASLGIAPAAFASLSSGYATDYFASDVALNPGDTVALTMGDTAADSSSINYHAATEYQFAADANTQALMPFGGTLAKVTTSTGGGASTPTFAPAATSIIPFALLLDSGGAFTPSGGPTVVVNPTINRFLGNPEDF